MHSLHNSQYCCLRAIQILTLFSYFISGKVCQITIRRKANNVLWRPNMLKYFITDCKKKICFRIFKNSNMKRLTITSICAFKKNVLAFIFIRFIWLSFIDCHNNLFSSSSLIYNIIRKFSTQMVIVLQFQYLLYLLCTVKFLSLEYAQWIFMPSQKHRK